MGRMTQHATDHRSHALTNLQIAEEHAAELEHRDTLDDPSPRDRVLFAATRRQLGEALKLSEVHALLYVGDQLARLSAPPSWRRFSSPPAPVVTLRPEV